MHSRFYNALILQDILQEKPLNSISNEYEITRGDIQGLQMQAADSSGILQCFCERLWWNGLSILFSRMNQRFNMGVQDELLELWRIRSLKPEKARILFNAKITTIEELKDRSHDELFKILMDGECYLMDGECHTSKMRQDYKNQFEARKKHTRNIINVVKREAEILWESLATEDSHDTEITDEPTLSRNKGTNKTDTDQTDNVIEPDDMIQMLSSDGEGSDESDIALSDNLESLVEENLLEDI